MGARGARWDYWYCVFLLSVLSKKTQYSEKLYEDGEYAGAGCCSGLTQISYVRVGFDGGSMLRSRSNR